VVTKVKVSAVVDKQLPAHFASAETELTLLLKKYYEWMESSGGVLDSSQNTYENFYLDSSDADFLKFFTKRIIPNIPQDALIDKRLITKYARQFYQSKGSEESFKFLFHAIYGQSVDIYYPKVDLFRTSSATWLGQHALKIYTPDPAILGIKGRKLIGQTSGASCIVQSVDSYLDHFVVSVDNPFGIFLVDEVVFVEPVNGDSVVYARTLGQVNSYRVDFGGIGYSVGEILTYAGGDGQDLVVVVSDVSDGGAIKKLSIMDGGFGYVSTAPTFVSASSGSGANISFYIGAMTSLSNFVDDTDFLSSSKKLQDGYYYQDYSYVLKSALSSYVYKLVVDSILHPAGTRQFAELIDDLTHAIVPWFVGIRDARSFLDKIIEPTTIPVVPSIRSFGGGVELIFLSMPSVVASGDIILPYADVEINQYADIRIIDINRSNSLSVKVIETLVDVV
jgi:hypothetical protein